MGRTVISIFTIIVLMTCTGLAYANSTGFTISGKITFSKTGTIYLLILDRDHFKDYEVLGKKGGETEKSTDGNTGIIIEVGDKEKEAGEIPFELKNIPTGTYAIRAFIDTNGNGKLDKGKFGPKEPWGNFKSIRPLMRSATFDEMKFDVENDINTIKFELK